MAIFNNIEGEDVFIKANEANGRDTTAGQGGVVKEF
jgi:hypothetical protein